MAKIIAQIILSGSQVLGRAFARALKQEYEASQEAAKMRGRTSRRDPRSERAGITLDEAKQILNVETIDDPKLIEERYKKLFEANEKVGSFYLQSKVFRARERINMELVSSQSNDGSKTKGPDLNQK
ncbi:mitochondrial import inner membrane translocase subunit tim16-like [Chrysoperla carnea]|uniref:mitochondrial import inner membrane translocase subunit tim16-like n=1 Tax=Chrysoperla carnea TaxID=189513 RepID=UPI001D075107|nr:mitochondrial import inner membrane translocase subunit tim16-like [Chrysoperla carnea]